MARDIFFHNVPPEKRNDPEETDFTDASFEDISDAHVRRRPPAPQTGEPQTVSRPAVRQPQQRRDDRPAAPTARGGKPAKKRGCFGRAIALLLVLLLAAAGAACVFAVRTCNYVLADYDTVKLEKNAYVNERELLHDPDVFNVLLLGVDFGEPGEPTRSDSMILLSLDTAHNKIKLTTFMRDMYVEIPGYGSTKLNHSCMYGGPQLTVDTIEKNFGVDIDAYVKINYGTFVDVVNGVGGVTVAEIDGVESDALADEGVYIDPGTDIHLDGGQALHYVRIRHGQSDFARTERQREVASLIVQKARKMKIRKLVDLARDVAGKIESSIPKSKLTSLALKSVKCLTGGEIEQQQIPADGAWEDGYRDDLMVLLIDLDVNRRIIKEFIYE